MSFLTLFVLNFYIFGFMSLFRSATMRYYELFIPTEDAYSVVAKLAPENFVEFLDAAANSFHKPYYNAIKRCDDVILKIDTIISHVKKYKIPLPEIPQVKEVFNKHEEILTTRKITNLTFVDNIQTEVEKSYISIEDSIRGVENAQKKIIDLEDYKYLLFKAREIFSTKQNKGDEQEIDFSRTTLEQLQLVNISGVIPSKDMLKFGKMIFRATKGHSILYTFSIPNDAMEAFSSSIIHESRTAFIVIIESGSNVLNKVTRICQSFAAKKYTLQTSKETIFQKIKQIEDTISDTKQLCSMTEKKLHQDLEFVVSLSECGCSKYEYFRIILQRQSLIYHTLNMLSVDHYKGKPGSTMIAKIWVPDDKKGTLLAYVPPVVTVREPLTDEKPPTYFQVNEFTAPFQEIVNTYGVPRYQEVNPGLFAISIFPFLFGIMFGDIGHGGVVLAFAIWMLKDPNSKRLLPDVYSIRYLILMMGSFAFFSGWIYNEFFSIPLNVFGSCYGHAKPEEEAQKMQGCVYPFGFDPKWIRAENQLNYFNSYKMKFAVIIGVAQMTLAIFLKMLNTLHFKNYIDFFFEWLPQQIFFFCTFGYMCILIIFKWMVPWGIERSTAEAPSIIGQMIALPLKAGSTEGKPLWDLEFQENMQYNLLMISLICVPWMLLIKPYLLWLKMPKVQEHEHKKHHELNENLIHEDGEDYLPPETTHTPMLTPSPAPSGNHEEHDDISEIAVHQIIETIEFILGSISNTASYLRLWALSLAHGQLARVFLEKTIGAGIVSANAIIIVLGQYFFFSITVGVIMGMDSMECFLHALRLQWVQFNSKFFKADGRKFNPLNFVEPVEKSLAALRAEEQ